MIWKGRNDYISQLLGPLLSQIELILRNAINNELNNYFSDSTWIRGLKGFPYMVKNKFQKNGSIN